MRLSYRRRRAEDVGIVRHASKIPPHGRNRDAQICARYRLAELTRHADIFPRYEDNGDGRQNDVHHKLAKSRAIALLSVQPSRVDSGPEGEHQ